MNTFARVVNGKVVEYPVTLTHIIARAEPVAFYTPVKEESKPPLSDGQSYQETLTVLPGVVYATYAARNMTVSELLIAANPVVVPGTSVETTPVDLKALEIAAKKEALQNLEKFVISSELGFTDVQDALSYLSSSLPEHKAAAVRVNELRDKVLSALQIYFAGVNSGTIPVPTNRESLFASAPTLTWTDVPAPVATPAPTVSAPVATPAPTVSAPVATPGPTVSAPVATPAVK